MCRSYGLVHSHRSYLRKPIGCSKGRTHRLF
jgi:hypothetical protein